MAKIEPTVASTADASLPTTLTPAPTYGTPYVVGSATPATEAAPVTDPRQLDQLSRIEEKAARIEEKFARYEAVLTRAEASLERSAHKVDAAAGTMDFAAIRGEIAALRDRVDATPRAATLFTTAIVTAVLTVVLTVLVLRFGVPGLMPRLLP
ncbi:hypothetical protein [Bosea vaviloviae]|uniref:Uncharacterized protein n=1 Tax=Bosea vaviloviae TaxID=1526658 RepID=A0A0N0MCV1_9HYPH|nr:hypothetical protein [Bosea vaviloviae]KPH81663.1 hypothetical protein AE618_07990 [Bosea vaviloviae]